MHGADTKYKQTREKCVAIHLKLLQFFLTWLLIGWKGGCRGLLPYMSSDWTRRLSNSYQTWPITVCQAGQLNSRQIWPMDRRMTAGQMNGHKSNRSPYGKESKWTLLSKKKQTNKTKHERTNERTKTNALDKIGIFQHREFLNKKAWKNSGNKVASFVAFQYTAKTNWKTIWFYLV